MPKVEVSREKIVEVLESKKPVSLTEVYRHLGGVGKLSGSTAGKIRNLFPDIEKVVAGNRAGEGKAKTVPVPTTGKVKFRTSKKTGKQPAAKNKIPRHPMNPFREGSGYGLLLDLIAEAGAKGIGKEDLLKAYCKATGKDLTHAKYDLAVINSAREDSDKRHRSCADSFVILKEGDCFRVRFE